MHCYRVAPHAVGIGVKSNLCWKPLLTSSCRSDVDSVCVRCSQAITNYSRSHGWSQLVLCPHPLTLPSNVWKTCPKVCWSMQLIYCLYKCNTTNIQETPRVATVDHLAVTLFSGWRGFSLFILNRFSLVFVTHGLQHQKGTFSYQNAVVLIWL